MFATLAACKISGSESEPDAGDASDPAAPRITGTISLTGDGETESASSLELRFTHADSSVTYFSQSHPRGEVEFPFDYAIGGGLADSADEWELTVWLSWGDGSEPVPQPGIPSASRTLDFGECRGDECFGRDGVDLVLDTSTE